MIARVGLILSLLAVVGAVVWWAWVSAWLGSEGTIAGVALEYLVVIIGFIWLGAFVVYVVRKAARMLSDA
jgi:hypothetical protein